MLGEIYKQEQIFADLSRLAKKFNVVIVTATQPKRENNNDFLTLSEIRKFTRKQLNNTIIVDYIDKLS